MGREPNYCVGCYVAVGSWLHLNPDHKWQLSATSFPLPAETGNKVTCFLVLFDI